LKPDTTTVRLKPDTTYVRLSLAELRNRAAIDVIHQHADGAEQRFEVSGHVAQFRHTLRHRDVRLLQRAGHDLRLLDHRRSAFQTKPRSTIALQPGVLAEVDDFQFAGDTAVVPHCAVLVDIHGARVDLDWTVDTQDRITFVGRQAAVGASHEMTVSRVALTLGGLHREESGSVNGHVETTAARPQPPP